MGVRCLITTLSGLESFLPCSPSPTAPDQMSSCLDFECRQRSSLLHMDPFDDRAFQDFNDDFGGGAAAGGPGAEALSPSTSSGMWGEVSQISC